MPDASGQWVETPGDGGSQSSFPVARPLFTEGECQEMPVSLFAVVVDCGDPLHQAEFWAQALGFTMSRRNPDEYQVSDPAGNGGSLYFMKVPESKTGKNRLHLDLLATGSMEAEVARLTDAGARMVEVRQDPASLDNPDTWTVLLDPEGNEFCVTSTATLTGWK